MAANDEAGAVDGVVEAAKVGEGLIDGGLNVGNVGDVALEREGVIGISGVDAGSQLR